MAIHAFSKRQFVATLTNQFVRSYRLLYQIRSGRFSQVWAAIDDSTGERFALKLLLDEFKKKRPSTFKACNTNSKSAVN